MKNINELMREVQASTTAHHGKEASGSSPAESATDPTDKGTAAQPTPDAPSMPGDSNKNTDTAAPTLPGGTELHHSGSNPQPTLQEPMEDFKAKVARMQNKLAAVFPGTAAPAAVLPKEAAAAAPGTVPAATQPAPASAPAPAVAPGAAASAPVVKLASYSGTAMNTLTAALLESERGPLLMKQALEEQLGLEEAENLIKQASAEVLDARRSEALTQLQQVEQNEWLAKCASARAARNSDLQTKVASVQDPLLREKIATSHAIIDRARAHYEGLGAYGPDAVAAFDFGVKTAAAMMDAEAAGQDPAAAVGPEEGAPASPEEIMQVVAMLAEAGLIPPESVQQIVAALGGGGEGGAPPGAEGAPPAGPEGGAPPPAAGPSGGEPPAGGPPAEPAGPPKDKEAAASFNIDAHLQKVASLVFSA